MNIAIILSGGVGSRMGRGIPKQYIEIEEKPIIWYCLKTFSECARIDALVIGCAFEWLEYVKNQVNNIRCQKPVFYSSPGETRQFSIYNALKVVKEQGYGESDVVIIHDAARPLVSKDLINRCIDECCTVGVDGILPVIAVKDTIYQSADGTSISNLLNRNELFAGQAPEAFLFDKYLHLHEMMSHDELLKINGSTEIAYKGGLSVKLIEGDEMNFKITTPEDLFNFESIVKNRQNESL